MERSGFFNAIATGVDADGIVKYDRTYKAEQFAEYFASFIANGVFPNPATCLQVVGVDNNMQVRIREGKAWINGYIYINTNDCIHKIDVADSLLNRIDRVVLRLDFLNREVKSYIKKGVFASTPVAPSLQRDADAYEICVAEIRVNKGVIKISTSDITDTRLNKSLCGIVHGAVEQVDTTEIFRQFQTWFLEKKSQYDIDFTNWTTEKKLEFSTWLTINTQNFINQWNDWFGKTEVWENDFNAWFEGVRNTLNGDVGGNLYNLIMSQKAEIETQVQIRIDELATDYYTFKLCLTEGFTSNQFSSIFDTLTSFVATNGYHDTSLKRLVV